jgi:hypothetical protein
MSLKDLGSNLERETPVAVKAKPIGMPERVKIILEENDNIPPTGQFFGVNGVSYILRAGEEVMATTGIIDILDNAVEARPIVDPNTMKTIGWRNRQRYPYRKIS